MIGTDMTKNELMAENKQLREALRAYVQTAHVRVHQGNDRPGYMLHVWTTDWDKGRRALAIHDNATRESETAHGGTVHLTKE